MHGNDCTHTGAFNTDYKSLIYKKDQLITLREGKCNRGFPWRPSPPSFGRGGYWWLPMTTCKGSSILGEGGAGMAEFQLQLLISRFLWWPRVIKLMGVAYLDPPASPFHIRCCFNEIHWSLWHHFLARLYMLVSHDKNYTMIFNTYSFLVLYMTTLDGARFT